MVPLAVALVPMVTVMHRLHLRSGVAAHQCPTQVLVWAQGLAQVQPWLVLAHVGRVQRWQTPCQTHWPP